MDKSGLLNVVQDHMNLTTTMHPMGVEEVHSDENPLHYHDLEFKVGQAHILGGTVWFLMYSALAWAAINRFFKSEMSKREGWVPGYEYVSSIPFTCSWFGHRPIIGMLMSGAGALTLASNSYGQFDKDFVGIHTAFLFSITMYGLAEVLFYYGLINVKNWDYFASFLVFFNLSLFSSIHYHGNPTPEHMLRVEAHKYLRYSTYMVTAGFMAELLNRKSAFAALAKCGGGLVGAVWSLAMGALYFHKRAVIGVGDTEEQLKEKRVFLRSLYVWVVIGCEFYIILLMVIGRIRVGHLKADTPTYELRPRNSKAIEANSGYPGKNSGYQEVKQLIPCDNEKFVISNGVEEK